MALFEQVGISLDQLLEMGEDARVEIIDGELIPMAGAGGTHQIVISNVFRILDAHVAPRELGLILPAGLTFLMNSDPKSLKHSFEPAVSFLRKSNIPIDWDVSKPFAGVPTLAIEVVSPNDQASRVARKVEVYLAKGTEQVWLLYPEVVALHQYISGSPTVFRIYEGEESQAIDASAFFLGIEGLTTSAIFAIPAWLKQQTSE